MLEVAAETSDRVSFIVFQNYTDTRTFQLRYLINETYWEPGNPIFFYTGNEGDIVTFAENTGFMWELAPKLGAMVVFAEHRFYGETMPFGNKSFTGKQYLGYLTSTQALADYIYLIQDLKVKYKADSTNTKSPVITFGGSYGGMLSAWIRLKYPSTVYAAVSSSAPIFQFTDITPCGSYFNIIASVFNLSSPGGACAKNIKKSWKEIHTINSTEEGKQWLSKTWNFCNSTSTKNGLDFLTDWMKDVFGNLAMVNYPYPTNFLAELPAHPIKTMCTYLSDPKLEGKPLLRALGRALSVYTNYTGQTKCLDFNKTTTSIGEEGWDFQACTEMVMPMCNEDNVMFERFDWNLQTYRENCQKKFGVAFTRDDDAVLQYGGKTAPYSNVIFTNGLLDPWSAGGMLQTSLPSVYSILIPNSAHHLDLRASNPADPQMVSTARRDIENILKNWIKMYKNEV